jgi:1-acyl-sn-glycerol-3-phosphate acyltransferase
MKHSMFRGPFGPIARSLGGIAVRRDRRSNLVKQMAELFREHPRLVLVVPAEGTRSRVEYWKSGFYHLAREARVPIVPSFLDYARRRGGFGPAIVPSNDMRADMDKIRAFYAGKLGKHPECFGPVRLREEEPSADA